MSTNGGYSKKILKLLAQKPALAISDISHIGPENALKRSLKGLSESGLIERHYSGQNDYARLTKEGKKKVHSLKLEDNSTPTPIWDGKWRIVLLDLPETRKDEREALRYLLKKAGFVCLKNSVWISPFPYEHLFTNIKKDFGLKEEMIIFKVEELDKDSQELFFKKADLSR